MHKISVKIPAAAAIHYPILLNTGLMDRPDEWLPKPSKLAKVIVITDHAVKKLYAEKLNNKLKKLGYNTLLLSFPPGEKSKNQKTKQYIENEMLRNQCGRDSLCLAVGGGVVGDLTGFIAATYMRGVPFIQIPTTLLAMVDSSVGGKTGINTAYGKNLIGAFWQPQMVLVDFQCLKSLPHKQLVNGLIEAIKVFLTNDAKSFRLIAKNLDKILQGEEKILKKIIANAIKIKADIVRQDEKENNGVRMILNFGHTIGHALEQLSGYKLLHGYAVALGILAEAKISVLMGFLSPQKYVMIESLLERLGISGKDLKKYDINKIIAATKLDKKAKQGNVRYILLSDIGNIQQHQHNVASTVSDTVMKKALLQILNNYKLD